MFDPKVVRKDFPILDRKVHGDKPLVYLDSGATSQKPRRVIDAMTQYYEQHNANVHRGVYEIAVEATDLYEGARSSLARFINAPSQQEVVFTKSATEATNLVAYTWGAANVREGDEIVLTEMEHHSNLVPWQMLAARTGARIVTWGVTDDGYLDMDALERVITDRTKIVGVTGMSNVLGTINPIARISEAAHAVGAIVVCDGAQLAPHRTVDVQALGCDFFAISGHKMLGPTGSGAVWGRRELLEAMPPFHGGGDMILEVWMDRATYNELPYKFEAGTPPIAEAVGLGAAVEYLHDLGMDDVARHETELVAYTFDKLSQIEGLTIHGPRALEDHGGVVSFHMEDVHPHDLATIVDTEGVCVRAGHHCAQPLMRRLGVAATTRASFSVFNTTEDVDALVVALEKARSTMAGGGLPF